MPSITTTSRATPLMRTLLLLLIADLLPDCTRGDILRISQPSPSSLPASSVVPEQSGKLNLQECFRLYRPARENCSISALDKYPELAPDITSQYCEYLNSTQICTVQAVCTACSNVSALEVYPHLYNLLKVDMRRADCAGHFFDNYAEVYGNVSRFVSNFVCSRATAVVILPHPRCFLLIIFNLLLWLFF